MHAMPPFGRSTLVFSLALAAAAALPVAAARAQEAPTCPDETVPAEAELLLRLAEVDTDAAAAETRLGAQHPRVIELRRRVVALRTLLATAMPVDGRAQSIALRELLRMQARLTTQKYLLALRLPAQHVDIVDVDRRLRALEPYVRVVESGRRRATPDAASPHAEPSLAEWLVDKALAEGRLGRLLTRYGERDPRTTIAREEITRAAAALAAPPGPTATDRSHAVARLGAIVRELRTRRDALLSGTTSSAATDLDDVDAVLDAAVIAAARLAAPAATPARSATVPRAR